MQGDLFGGQDTRPLGVVPLDELSCFAGIVMSGRKLLDRLAYGIKSFHFARDVSSTIMAPSYVEWNNADVVSRDEEIPSAFVEESKRENPAEHVA